MCIRDSFSREATQPTSKLSLIIIIIIKAICNAQDPLKKAANALSGSEKM